MKRKCLVQKNHNSAAKVQLFFDIRKYFRKKKIFFIVSIAYIIFFL